MKEKKLVQWVLRQSNGTYFKKWTGIGPMTTVNPDEAEKFESREDAMRSPAYTFSMTFFEPLTSNHKK